VPAGSGLVGPLELAADCPSAKKETESGQQQHTLGSERGYFMEVRIQESSTVATKNAVGAALGILRGEPSKRTTCSILLPIAGVFFGYRCGGSVVGDKCSAKRFDMAGNCLKLGVASTCLVDGLIDPLP
jgi:hypothetical protein